MAVTTKQLGEISKSLGANCSIISSGIARLHLASPDPIAMSLMSPDSILSQYPELSDAAWTDAEVTGALVLIKDRDINALMFQVYSINQEDTILFEYEVYEDMEYTELAAGFHCFEMEECMAGFAFADAKVAGGFLKKVVASTPKSSHSSRSIPVGVKASKDTRNQSVAEAFGKKGSNSRANSFQMFNSDKVKKKRKGFFGKRKKKKGIDLAEIGDVEYSEHKGHIGISAEGGLNMRNLPDEWKHMFKMAGIRKKDLQDEATAAEIIKTIQTAEMDLHYQKQAEEKGIDPDSLQEYYTPQQRLAFERYQEELRQYNESLTSPNAGDYRSSFAEIASPRPAVPPRRVEPPAKPPRASRIASPDPMSPPAKPPRASRVAAPEPMSPPTKPPRASRVAAPEPMSPPTKPSRGTKTPRSHQPQPLSNKPPKSKEQINLAALENLMNPSKEAVTRSMRESRIEPKSQPQNQRRQPSVPAMQDVVLPKSSSSRNQKKWQKNEQHNSGFSFLSESGANNQPEPAVQEPALQEVPKRFAQGGTLMKMDRRTMAVETKDIPKPEPVLQEVPRRFAQGGTLMQMDRRTMAVETKDIPVLQEVPRRFAQGGTLMRMNRRTMAVETQDIPEPEPILEEVPRRFAQGGTLMRMKRRTMNVETKDIPETVQDDASDEIDNLFHPPRGSQIAVKKTAPDLPPAPATGKPSMPPLPGTNKPSMPAPPQKVKPELPPLPPSPEEVMKMNPAPVEKNHDDKTEELREMEKKMKHAMEEAEKVRQEAEELKQARALMIKQQEEKEAQYLEELEKQAEKVPEKEIVIEREVVIQKEVVEVVRYEKSEELLEMERKMKEAMQEAEKIRQEATELKQARELMLKQQEEKEALHFEQMEKQQKELDIVKQRAEELAIAKEKEEMEKIKLQEAKELADVARKELEKQKQLTDNEREEALRRVAETQKAVREAQLRMEETEEKLMQAEARAKALPPPPPDLKKLPKLPPLQKKAAPVIPPLPPLPPLPPPPGLEIKKPEEKKPEPIPEPKKKAPPRPTGPLNAIVMAGITDGVKLKKVEPVKKKLPPGLSVMAELKAKQKVLRPKGQQRRSVMRALSVRLGRMRLLNNKDQANNLMESLQTTILQRRQRMKGKTGHENTENDSDSDWSL